MSGSKNCGTFTQWNSTQQRERRTAWMELESIMLSEISQVVKHKYHISPISGTLSTKQISEQNRTRDMETKNKFIPLPIALLRGEAGGG